MKTARLWILFLTSFNCLPSEGFPAEPVRYCSPIAMAQGDAKNIVYVADVGKCAILAADLISREIRSRFPLNDRPSGLVCLKKKPLIIATLGVPDGKVVGIDSNTGAESFSISVGHTPCSPVLSNDEDTLYLCNRFDNTVAAYDLKSLLQKWSTPVPREPVAVAGTPDGATLVVANLLPFGAATQRPFSADVSVINVTDGSLIANIALPNGSTGVQGVTISPDGKFAYVTHTLGRYQSPTKQVDFGWMNVNALSVIDLSTLKSLATVSLDDFELGAANPWGLACSADGRTLVVAHAGSRELSIINLKAVHEKLARLAAGEAVSQVSTELACVQNDLEFLKDIRRRIALPGDGPRAVLLSGSTAVVSEYFSGKLAVVDLNAPFAIREILLDSSTSEPDQARRGEILFASALKCRQHWQSCASCHPDARIDAFNWDLMNDGVGNPKNVKSLLDVYHASPATWMGVRENAETAVRSGFRYIQFHTISEDDAQCVDSYLKSLLPVPGPVAINPAFHDSIAKGKKLFSSNGCIRCHSGEYFTDGKAYDVGTAKGVDAGKPVVTPPLRECWRTAPYLHDGRDPDLYHVLQDHGNAIDLSQEDQSDLVNYLLSL